MVDRGTDRIADAVRLLGALGAVVADPTLLAALKSGPEAHDALKRLAADPPPGGARLTGDLTAEARALFQATRDLPPDAEALFAQMVEAGLVAAPEIVAADMDAGAVVEAMLGNLTAPEHRSGPMQALYRSVATPTLTRLLADNGFADDLRAAFMTEVLRRLGDLNARLAHVDRLTRLEMTALGDRFEVAGMYALSDAELRKALELKAEEYRAYRARIEAIDERMAGLGPIKAAARDAAERLDLDEVEARLARVDVVETEIAAETKVLRADNALLRGRVEDAFRMLSAAADAFASVDPDQPARQRLDYGVPLYEHGLRYGGDGLGAAVAMWRRALEDLSEAAHPVHWAQTQNNIGVALSIQGERLGGEAGTALLFEAVAALRATLSVLTEAAYPWDWAMTQNNLGNALQSQGARLGAAAGVDVLGEAVAAYRGALRVLSETAHSVDWATTQNNLGTTLRAKWMLIGGAEGAALLGDAVTAYRAALRVWKEAAHPVNWATTHNNLGTALQAQARGLGGVAGADLFGEAVAAYRGALRVQTELAHPVDWAITQNNLGTALLAQGAWLGGVEGTDLLGEGVAAFRAALRIWTEEAQPVHWARTTENLGLAQEALAENPTGDDPCIELWAAAGCFEAALRVFTSQHHPYEHSKAVASLARVRARLDRDCGPPAAPGLGPCA